MSAHRHTHTHTHTHDDKIMSVVQGFVVHTHMCRYVRKGREGGREGGFTVSDFGPNE